MFNFLLYRTIFLVFSGVSILFGLYGLFSYENFSKLTCLSLILIGASFLIYGRDYDELDYKRANRRRRISNLILVGAAGFYILKIVLDYNA
jgi:hypothetical protein